VVHLLRLEDGFLAQDLDCVELIPAPSSHYTPLRSHPNQ
jgi:hypothetical protein